MSQHFTSQASKDKNLSAVNHCSSHLWSFRRDDLTVAAVAVAPVFRHLSGVTCRWRFGRFCCGHRGCGKTRRSNYLIENSRLDFILCCPPDLVPVYWVSAGCRSVPRAPSGRSGTSGRLEPAPVQSAQSEQPSAPSSLVSGDAGRSDQSVFCEKQLNVVLAKCSSDLMEVDLHNVLTTHLLEPGN